jgi:protein-arginine kinase activator protein McsA
MKTCSKCQQSKAEAEFNKQSRSKDGFKSICRACDKEINKARYLKLQPKIMEQVLAWQAKNPEKVAAAKTKYRQKHSQ